MIMFRLSLPRDQLLYHQRNEIFLADTGHDPGHDVTVNLIVSTWSLSHQS